MKRWKVWEVFHNLNGIQRISNEPNGSLWDVFGRDRHLVVWKHNVDGLENDNPVKTWDTVMCVWQDISVRDGSHQSCDGVGNWRMPVTNLWIRFRWLISATRFVEQAGITYSRCGRSKAPYKGMKADLKGTPYNEVLSPCFICGVSALSRGRKCIIRLNP